MNEFNAISVLGDPYKISDINKYLLTLNQHEQDYTHDKIVEDLNNVFNSSREDLIAGVTGLQSLLPSFFDANGNINTKALFEYLKDKPQYLAILKDIIPMVNNSDVRLTHVIVFSWDQLECQTKLAHYISLGNSLASSPPLEILPNVVYTRFSSATRKPEQTTDLQAELAQQMNSLIDGEWDANPGRVDAVIETAKGVISEGLIRMNPYTTPPKVVFYELSYRTNFIFLEPEISLRRIEYQRPSA